MFAVDVLDEESTRGAISEPGALELGLLEPASQEGHEPRIVTYSELDSQQKGQVLADLLVKSAINQALDTRNQVRGAMTRLHHFCSFVVALYFMVRI